MLEYVNKKYNNHKLEQDLQGSVLKSNPVLRSMVKTPKLDTFVKYLLEKKTQILWNKKWRDTDRNSDKHSDCCRPTDKAVVCY